MFNDFKLTYDRPVYIQMRDYLKRLIIKGSLQADQKLPSTRELGLLLAVSRNTVISAYAETEQAYDCAYFIPSYHNPTGIVTSPEKRLAIMQLMARHCIPVIEDGFNEELRYSGSHVSPLIATAGQGNGVIYIGSFSKVLFPGLRVGWVLADRRLIDCLESIKRARSIHTSTLDQSVLFQYLYNGNLEKYLKKARAEYKRKYEWTKRCCEMHLPYKRLSGDGGLHLFVEFDEYFDTTALLNACSSQGVIFTPGDMFYTDGGGRHTMRLGFSRVPDDDIGKGLEIIGRTAKQLMRFVQPS